jgi:hypothetical protein
MQRSTKRYPEQTQADIDGREALIAWLGAKTGRGAYLADRTGFDVATISRMKSGFTRITLEAAVLIELGTERALKAEILCPALAGVIKKFRSAEDGTAQKKQV